MKPMQALCALGAFLTLAPFLAGTALAHVPLFVCGAEGDDTITCEGGLSDGSSVEGLPVRVADGAGALLFEGKLGRDHTVHFPRPKAADFTVTFDAGEGHTVTLKPGDID